MQINLSNIKQEIKIIEKLEEQYENLYLNYYDKIVEIEKQWNSIYEKRLMQIIEQEKKYMNITHSNIIELNSLYKFINNKYSDIGQKIEIDLSKEDIILNKINYCIELSQHIINLCNSIDTKDMTNPQIYALNNAKYKTQRQLTKLRELRTSLSNTFDKFRKIENDIKQKISEFNIDIIKQTDISDCIAH